MLTWPRKAIQQTNKLMFDNAISLNPTSFGGANVTKVYDLVGMGSDSASLRRVSATAATTPETLTISHREVKEGGQPVQQHLLRLDTNIIDPLKGTIRYSAWLVIKVPQGTSVITTALIKDQVGRLIALEQSAGAIEKILNSEP